MKRFFFFWFIVFCCFIDAYSQSVSDSSNRKIRWQINAYPLNLITGELRVAWQTQFKSNVSLEIGGGYVFKILQIEEPEINSNNSTFDFLNLEKTRGYVLR